MAPHRADAGRRHHWSCNVQKALLQILTTDLVVNPSDGDRLFTSVKELLIKYPEGKEGKAEAALLTITSGDMENIQPQLTAFLLAYMAGKAQSPPGDVNKLQGWGEGVGKDMRLLWPFYHAIVNTAEKEKLDAEKSSEFAKGFLVTLLLAGPAELLAPWLAPEEGYGIVGYKALDKILTKLMFGGGAGGVVYQTEPYVTDLANWMFGVKDPEDPEQELEQVTRNYTALYIAQQLYQHRMIVDKHGNTITWDQASGGAGLDGLLKNIGPDVSSSGWLKEQQLRIPGEDEPGAFQNLQALINSVLGVESNHPSEG